MTLNRKEHVHILFWWILRGFVSSFCTGVEEADFTHTMYMYTVTHTLLGDR